MGPNGNATGAPAWTFAKGGVGVGGREGLGKGGVGGGFWEKVWRERVMGVGVGGNGVVVYFGLVGVDLIERIGGE